MENLISQFFLAPTTTPGTASVGKQSNQNTDTKGFGALLEKARQTGQDASTGDTDTIFTNLNSEQLQALSVLYAQIQSQNQSAETQPQPLAISTNAAGTDIVTAQIEQQSILQNFTTEQLSFLQQLNNLTQSTMKNGMQSAEFASQQLDQLQTTQQQIPQTQHALADKIFQIIESQSVAQNISVQTASTGSTTNPETAILAQASSNFSTALEAITQPKVKSENTKAAYSATSSLVTPKVGKDTPTTNNNFLTTAQNVNTDLAEGNKLTPSSTTYLGKENTEDSSIFSQLFATTTSSTNQSTLHGQTPVVLPSGRLVYDDQVLQQFSQQIRINTNELQQKINIRLNPAELGELKIDLTMKEGNVRVNVLAHSQQAQEILERNMPKLRNILEKQGLSVEGITVTQESSSLSDFTQFQDQLTQDQSNQNQQYKESHPHNSSVSQKVEVIEENVEITSKSAKENSNSVNLVA